MAGIYIHIPFCNKRCHYCDFYSSVNTKLLGTFLNVVQIEIEQQQNLFVLNAESVKTIYIGGGTPSLLSVDQLNTLITTLKKRFTIEKNPELTIEVNPDDVSLEYFKLLKYIGINRVSIGIQSFDDDYLKLMNRRHSANEAIKSVENAFKAGICNISVDLIYGLPGMSLLEWEKTLNFVFELPIKHLSAYHLGIEDGTVFHNWMKKGKIAPIPDELSFKQFELLSLMAQDKGFEHYEISNLALTDYKSEHNSAYWDDKPYLGFGPSAHSYNGEIRKWNISNINKYIDSINNQERFWESEVLTKIDKLNEHIMTRLRTNRGIDLKIFESKFGSENLLKLKKQIEFCYDNSNSIYADNVLKLSTKGWFISDKIISELMFSA